MSNYERDYIVSRIQDYLYSIHGSLDKFRDGSDVEKGYLLEKINALRDCVEREM